MVTATERRTTFGGLSDEPRSWLFFLFSLGMLRAIPRRGPLEGGIPETLSGRLPANPRSFRKNPGPDAAGRFFRESPSCSPWAELFSSCWTSRALAESCCSSSVVLWLACSNSLVSLKIYIGYIFPALSRRQSPVAPGLRFRESVLKVAAPPRLPGGARLPIG